MVTLTLGSFFISNHLYERGRNKFNLQLIDVNLITKFLIVLLGCSVVSWRSLIDATPEMQLVGAAIGMLIGYVCIKLESSIILLLRNSLLASPTISNMSAISIKNILGNTKKEFIKTPYQPSYFPIIMVGVLEEILYRGFLTALCISLLSPSASISILIVVTFIFALNHLNLGNVHILTKFILGIFCLLSFLITKTIVTPIFIHATFNALVINKYRKLAYD